MSEKVFYTLYDPKSHKDIGGKYAANKGNIIGAAKKAAKSDHVFPEKKDYTTAKKIYLRRMDGARLEENKEIFCYSVTQKMVEAPAALKKLGVKGKIREVKAKPCNE